MINVVQEIVDKLRTVYPSEQYDIYTERIEQGFSAPCFSIRQLRADVTPYKTEHLKRNWFITHARRSGKHYRAEIYNNVFYAPYVENGHRIVHKGVTHGFVEGKHMLRDSLFDLQKKAPDFIKTKSEEFLSRMMEGK